MACVLRFLHKSYTITIVRLVKPTTASEKQTMVMIQLLEMRAILKMTLDLSTVLVLC